MSEPKYISHEEAEKTTDPWRLVRLRLKEHELYIVTTGEATGAGAWLTRNRLLEAIGAYGKSKEPKP